MTVTIGAGGERRLKFWLPIALVVLGACDLLLTRHLILDLGAHEGNPVMVLIVTTGIGAAVKIGLPVVLALRHFSAPLHRWVVLGLCWVTVLYLYVVAWNLHQLGAYAR